MPQVIIINGPSCSGESTIAKEICNQSGNKFVHLQIDEASKSIPFDIKKCIILQKMLTEQTSYT